MDKELYEKAASVIAGVAAKTKQDVANNVPDPKSADHAKLVENAARVQGQDIEKLVGGGGGGSEPDQQQAAVLFDASKTGEPADVAARRAIATGATPS